MKILNSTLIIPSYSTTEPLDFFFENLLTWTSFPKEIIVVNTNKKKVSINKIFVNFLNKKKNKN